MKTKNLSDREFLAAALEVARHSRHPRNKIGAILVSPKGQIIAKAANGLAPGVHKKAIRFQEGHKSDWFECAEKLIIAMAAKHGKATQDATLYVAAIYIEPKGQEVITGITPCGRCAGVLAAAGIGRVVTYRTKPQGIKPKWQHGLVIGREKLREAKIAIQFKLHKPVL